MQPKIPIFLAVLLNAAQGLSQSCPSGYTASSSAPSSTSASSTSATAAATPSGGSKLSWTDCATSGSKNLQCATLRVPLDYSSTSQKRDATMLELPIVRIPAKDSDGNSAASNKSVLINPGGPGESGIDFVIKGGEDFQTTIGTGFNVVSFDPRGVGLDMPYECPTVQYDSSNYDASNDPDGVGLTFQQNVYQAQTCANATYNAAGQLIGTAFVARDILSIVNALAEDGLIRYYGYSYGTLLGATVAAMFPDKIDRMVLDGNVNPTDYYHGDGSEGSTDIDKATAHFFDLCADAGQAKCALAVQGQSGDQLKETYVNFLNGLKNGTITAKGSDGQSIDSFGVKSKFFKVLYNPGLFTTFSSELSTIYGTQTASTPRQQQGARLIRRFDPAQAGVVNSTQSTAAISGCDFFRTGTATVDRFRQLLSIYNAKSFFAGEVAVSNQQGVETWQVTAKERPSSSFSNIATKNPILFVNTIYDPVCPLISAQRSSAGFLLSKVKIHNGAGHCSNVDPSETLNKEIAQYFSTGNLPDTSTATNPDRANPFKSASAQQKRSVEEKKYTQALQNLAKIDMDNIGSVTRPEALKAAKRDVYELLVRQEQTIPSGCVPIRSSAISSATSSAASSTASVASNTSGSTSQTSTAGTSRDSSISRSSTTASQIISSLSSFTSPVSISSAMSATTSETTTVSGITTDSSSKSTSVSSDSSASSVVISSTLADGSTTITPITSASLVSPSSTSNIANTSSRGSTDITFSGTQTGTLSSITSASTSAVLPSGTRSSSSGIASSVSGSAASGTQTSSASVVISSSISNSQTSGINVSGTTSTVPIASPSGTSVAVVNGTSFILEADTTYAGSSLNGLPIAKKAVTTLDACLSSCAENVACVGAAIGIAQGSCTLYGSIILASKRSAQGVTFATVVPRRAFNSGSSIVLGSPTSAPLTTVGISSQNSNASITSTALPSTTVWVTSVVDVCPTGLTTSLITVTAACPGGCSTRPTGIPQGYTTTVVYCSACATPSSVFVTTPIASMTDSNAGNEPKTVTAYNGPKSSSLIGSCASGSCSGGNADNGSNGGNSGNSKNPDLSKTVTAQTAQTAVNVVGGNNNIGGSQASKTTSANSNLDKGGLVTSISTTSPLVPNSTWKPTMALYTGSAARLRITRLSLVIFSIALSIIL